MRTIGINAPANLAHMFSGALQRYSMLEDQHGECSQLTLLFQGRAGVTLWSEMHDIADKIEVGVLSVREVNSDPDVSISAFPKTGTWRSETISPPRTVTGFWKLSIIEREAVCESGLRLVLSDGTDLTVLPSAFPCHIVPIRNSIALNDKPTEYRYESYTQERIF